MTNNSLVSIIIPFFNAEQFFQETIKSVLNQSYTDWELLLVDDGSTDGSTQIAKYYVEQHLHKIRFLEHEGHQNLGMSATRNLGIRHSRGKYITFLDSDDVWLPNKLEQHVALIESYPDIDLVCGRAQWWYSWTNQPEDLHRDFVQKLDVPLNTPIQPPTLLLLYLGNEWASLCDVLVRREIVEEVGGYEERFRGMYEDQAFHAKLCLKSPVLVASDWGYRYRQHPRSCTRLSQQMNQKAATRLLFLNWLEDYLSKQSAQGTELWQVLQKEMWAYRHPALYGLLKTVRQSLKPIKEMLKRLVRQLLPTSVSS